MVPALHDGMVNAAGCRAYFNMLTGEAISSPVIVNSSPVMTICLPS